MRRRRARKRGAEDAGERPAAGIGGRGRRRREPRRHAVHGQGSRAPARPDRRLSALRTRSAGRARTRPGPLPQGLQQSPTGRRRCARTTSPTGSTTRRSACPWTPYRGPRWRASTIRASACARSRRRGPSIRSRRTRSRSRRCWARASGAPRTALGLTGSLLLGLHTPASDIDLVVYGDQDVSPGARGADASAGRPVLGRRAPSGRGTRGDPRGAPRGHPAVRRRVRTPAGSAR